MYPTHHMHGYRSPAAAGPGGGVSQPPPYETAPSSRAAADAAAAPVREIKLYESTKERRKFEDLANLYSVLKALDMLERAYASDSVTADDYTKVCSRLLSQYKTSEGALVHDGLITDVNSFVSDYQLECSRALERVRLGVPATVLHRSGDTMGEAVHVAETVQYFITAMDALKLGQMAVDEIHPLMSDLMNSLNRVNNLPSTYEGRGKIERWLVTLNGMRASEELSEEQARQLTFDLDNAYGEFHRFLQSLKK